MQQAPRGGGGGGLDRRGAGSDDSDASPSDEWLKQLNATCNRLSTQYLQLLRAAGSVDDGSSGGGGGGGDHPNQHNPRSGSRQHVMKSTQDPPPPPLAANVASSLVQCQVAAENLNVAASSLLTLIRTLKLSLLLTDSDTMEAEQELECRACQEEAAQALREASELEQTLMELRRQR
jgi:Surfeit locus protein 5 subunit 22 of Mediator complex